MHSQAITYAKLAESPAIRSGSPQSSTEADRLDDESGSPTVLPVSAETAGLLPNRKGNTSLGFYHCMILYGLCQGFGH